MPRLEGTRLEIPDKLLSLLSPFTIHSAHTTHTYQLSSSHWAGALDRFKRSQRQGSRVGWTPARKERTNEGRPKQKLSELIYELQCNREQDDGQRKRTHEVGVDFVGNDRQPQSLGDA